MTDAFILAGFLVTRPVPRTSWMSADLAPRRVLTASECIASIVPSTWALEWVREERSSRIEKLRAFGLDDTVLDDVIAWTTSKFENGFAWPSFFTDIETARAFVERFVPVEHDARMLALCLSADDAAAIVDELASPSAGAGESALVQVVRRRCAPPAGGKELGSDLLCADHTGSFHSFLCNGLEVDIAARGLVANLLGLYDDHDGARAAAGAIEAGGTAEPGIWRAYRVLEYARRDEAGTTTAR